MCIISKNLYRTAKRRAGDGQKELNVSEELITNVS